MQCAEASCFLEVVFLWFFHLWLLLGTRFLTFWVSKTYRLTGLVSPFSYPEDHFVSLGTPERTMEGHMGAQNQMTESTPRVIGVAVGER